MRFSNTHLKPPPGIERQGIVVVNKPAGITSHDVVSYIRRKFNMKRVGHAGTLDPMATGVLIILLGKSTKLFDKFVAFDKGYRATLRLGLKTTSADIMGKTIEEKGYNMVTKEQLEKVFVQFTGEIDQKPPMVSAVKHKGERLYKLARQGKDVERVARKVRIDTLKLLRFDAPDAEFFMACSKGTYVRQLAEDVGDVLGCGACICQIERTKVGPFEIEKSVTLEELNESHIQSWNG
jgi:tRNA pseudouridine55 synthase